MHLLIEEEAPDVLKSMVDEIILIFKSESYNLEQKRQVIESLVGKLGNEPYSEMF